MNEHPMWIALKVAVYFVGLVTFIIAMIVFLSGCNYYCACHKTCDYKNMKSCEPINAESTRSGTCPAK